MVVQTWVFGRHFLRDVWNEYHFKENMLFVANNTNWAFKKIRILENLSICYNECESFMKIKDFSDDVGGGINK